MTSMPAFPPLSQGLLPYWIMIAVSSSMYNTVQNFVVTWQTKEIYAKKEDEVTPLACRLFGTWTFYSGVVRGYAAFHLSDPVMYNLALLAFATSGFHYFSEYLIFRSIKFNRASLGPMIVPTLTLVWMVAQKDYYLSL